ncbi:MAG: glycosyltransferase family 4 protein, partial [Pyrinomonadaceae bacterium]
MKETARLWVLTEPYYPEETSTGYYLTRIAEGLAEDIPVSVICGQPNYSARGHIAPPRETHKNVDIYRAGGTRLDKNVIVFRLVNMLTNGIAIFAKALQKFRNGDRVLVVTTPPSLPFVAAVASLVRGASYTLLIHDNYPEILIAAKKTHPNSAIVRVNHFLNRWLYKYAARIVVVGRDMEHLVGKKAAGLDVPITTITNWGENDAVVPIARSENRLLRELGLDDKFVFLYAGNIGYPNDIESIISAAEELKATPEIHFIFLGAGAKRKWLLDEVRTRGITNVSILEPRPRTEQI